MNSFLAIFYSVVLGLVFFIFLFQLLSLRRKKKILGKIQAKWSSFYNFSSLWNRVGLSLLFLYLVWCFYQIASTPKSSSGYQRLLFLIILLSLTPRWNVYLGSEGILLNMRFIPCKNILEKKIVARGKRKYLEIKGTLSPGLSTVEIKRIFLPEHVYRTMEKQET